jgi:hypothetical protein
MIAVWNLDMLVRWNLVCSIPLIKAKLIRGAPRGGAPFGIAYVENLITKLNYGVL